MITTIMNMSMNTGIITNTGTWTTSVPSSTAEP